MATHGIWRAANELQDTDDTRRSAELGRALFISQPAHEKDYREDTPQTSI